MVDKRNSFSWWLDKAARFGDNLSPCTRRTVGALIVARHYRDDFEIVARGFNVGPVGEPSCAEGGCPRGLLSYEECPPYTEYHGRSNPSVRCHATHAEVQAIQNYKVRLFGIAYQKLPIPLDPVMFVSHKPCDGCAEFCERARITTIWR